MATITMYNDINVDDAFLPVFAVVATGTSVVATNTDTTAAWATKALPSVANWNSVCYGNKQMVAVAGGPSTKAATGIGSATATWTARTLPASKEWQSVMFGNGIFITISNGTTDTATSPDGITWSTGGVMPSSAAWYCLEYGAGTFVAVSTTNSTAAAYSIDNGTSWVSATLPAAKNWQSVCYGNGKFIAVSYGTTDVAISTDGTSWSAAGSMPNARNWSSVTWGNPGKTTNGIFVAVAYGTSVGAISTDNGTTWTEVAIVPNVVFNGSFTGSADGWTLGAGWTWGSDKVTHTNGGGVATLAPVPALTVVAASLYEVTYTITGVANGNVTMKIGNTSGTARSTNGTFTEVITAANTNNLTFTPTTAFDGSIDDVSVKLNGNWNCISYGEIAAQGIKVFTVTGTGTATTPVSFDGSYWFLKAINTSNTWKYHCFAPITWNSGDTLSIQNNATVTINTNQTKFWKTIPVTTGAIYGKLSIQNNDTSNAINFYMGRASAATANDITPTSGAFSIIVNGNWIQLGATGDGTANQTRTASYTEYIPSLWVETGSGTGVFEVWNNVTGAYGPYVKFFGKDGLDLVGNGKRGNYFTQTAVANPLAILSLTSGVTSIQSYYVTCTDTTGVFPGATITGTNIAANTVVNRVVNSTTIELNAVATADGSSITFTVFNPFQSQFTTTINFGDGVNGNVIPNGAKVLQPNIMISDATAANLKTAGHLVDTYINMSNGGIIDARICLFGDVYANFAQAASVYLRNVGFAYQWALSECYSVDMDYVGNAPHPTYWYYTTKWVCRDSRYGATVPVGYTALTASTTSALALSYIHNAVIKHWHKVVYCPNTFPATAVQPVDLSYTNDAVWQNIRIVVLYDTAAMRALNISNRVFRNTFTTLEFYGCVPLQIITSDNNVFSGIEYSLSMFSHIKSFKTGMRISEDTTNTPLVDNIPVYFKTRTFFSWLNRTSYYESGEYSATPFQGGWLFPDTLSVRPLETTPAAVTFNWTERDPTSATTTAYEIHRSTSQGFSTRDSTTPVFRIAAIATATFQDGPRLTFTASGGNSLTFNVNKTIARGSVNWATDGYVVGDVIDITGTTANNGTYTINTIATLTLTVNETLVTETAYTSLATVTGRAPVQDTKYYYRMRKFYSNTAHVDCSVQSGSTTMTCSGVNTNLDFTNLYSFTDFYYDNGSTVIRNRKTNLFATPFYVGAVITGTGIPANTTILTMDAAGRELTISQPTTSSATNATIYLPVQAGMAVIWNINKPGSGLPYGTTVASVESATSLTLSNAATADISYLTNGTFTGNANGWTLGGGGGGSDWTYGSNAVAHANGGGVNTLTPSTPLNIVIGGVYTLTFTISNYSGAGTVTATVGGVGGTARGANGTFIQAFTATTTGNLFFTPTNTFVGTIDNVYLGVTLNFLPFTESPELVVTPHDYTSATNLCLQSQALGNATWTQSNLTVAAASFQGPHNLAFSGSTATPLTATGTNGTLTQSVGGLTISSVYSASIWVRADQTQALPNGVAGSLAWGTVTTNFTATNDWQKISANNFTATGTSHNLVITINTSGQIIWATDAMVMAGTSTTGNIVTTTLAITLKPCSIPLTTLYSYARNPDMVGSTGNQGIHVTLGGAIAGAYANEIYMSTTSGFTPSDSNRVANTLAVDAAPFTITGASYNNFSSITKLPGGGSSSAAGTGLFYITGSSNNNAFVDVNMDYTYCNTTAIPALHLISPAQNNVFHNIDFGRIGNYLATSVIWNALAVNSVTGNRLQNIRAKHYDLPFNDQTLAAKFKGIAGGNSYPTGAASTFALGNTIDGFDVAKTASYGSMFNEFYFGNPANIVSNGTFIGGSTGWTLSSGWSYGSGKVTHAASGGTGTLVPNPALTITAATNYEVTYTVSGRTAGSVTVSIGGTSGTARSANGTYTEVITTTTTGNLTFTPTNTFDGSIDDILAKPYANAGMLHLIFEDTQGVKPYTTTGSPKFNNAGKLFLPTVNDTITITWPWKIKGVTGFENAMPRLLGADFGNNANLLDGLKIEYSINSGSFKRLTTSNLVGEGALDAVNGFDFQLRLTPQVFMKFSTQVTGTMTSYTIATPGVITISGNPTWAVDQKVLYTTTGLPFGGLTNETFYYVAAPNTSPTTTFQLATTPGGTPIALSSATGSGTHTFNVLFEAGQIVEGGTSYATGTISEVYYDSVTAGTLVFSSTSGSWVAAEIIRTNDLKAIKATNVATNTFALGPSYTSYINALQIYTTVDQTKHYDAAIVTVTLTNIVPNSRYYIYNLDTSEQIATGTATGTPAPGETTIDYGVSVVYESDFNITVNVRKSSAPVKYLPYSTGATVTSAGANAFIAQVVDTVVLNSYGSIASDFTIDVTNNTIKHTSGTTVYTVDQLYSWLLDYFDEIGYLVDQIPMSASTPTEYSLINGWFINDPSFQYLSGGAVSSNGQSGVIYLLSFGGTYTNAITGDLGKVVTNSGATHTGTLLDYDNTRKVWWVRKTLGTITAEAVTITTGTGAGTTTGVTTGESGWSNIFTLGSLISGTTLDVYQNDLEITPWWSSGQIDIVIKVEEAGTEIDSGNLTVLARKYGTLYDHFVIDATSGRNPVPLAAFNDGNNQTASGTVSGYSDITITFGHTSKDSGNGNGLQPYDVIVNCNNRTLQQVYEYLKYVTRSGSATTINGVPGEFYTAVGDVRFDYDTEASGPFTETELISGTGGVYGHLVSLIDNGSTGTLVLRNVHGTFTDNMTLTGGTSTATALVNGGATSIVPQKQAPFGTFAGGQFFGAQGVWLDNVNSSDANNYQLIDSTGTTQAPPASIFVKVTGLLSGDRVSMFRTTGDNEIIDKSVYTSHASSNSSGNSSFVIQGSIASDTPVTGNLRVVHRAADGSIISEQSYAYTAWASSTFTLSGTLSMSYNGNDTAYVPYIDAQASSTSIQVEITYPGSDRSVVTRVRKKGIIPFTVKGTVASTGLTVTAIRTDDTIVT